MNVDTVSAVDVASGTQPPSASGRMLPATKRSSGGLTMGLMVAPSLVLVLLIATYPILYGAVQSVHDGNLIEEGPFIGLQNYVDQLTDPVFWSAARFTLIFTVVGVLGSWAVGLGLALFLQTVIPLKSVFKTLLLLPWVVPVVVTAMSWNWLVATPQSLVPSLFHMVGLESPGFLSEPTAAAITVFCFKIWISFPFMLLMMSSALAAVDRGQYEAASIDGATGWQKFRFITLPLIAPSTKISWILMTIWCVNDFPTIYLLTAGGPVDATTSLVILAYQRVFLDQQTGPGAAISFLMTLALVITSVFLYRRIKKGSVEL